MSGFTSHFSALPRFAEAATGLLFPPHCAVCNIPLKGNRILCPACRLSAERIKLPFCQVCSESFPGGSSQFICMQCEGSHFSFECAIAAFRFRGVVRQLIHRFKYGGEYWLRQQLVAWFLRSFSDDRLVHLKIDMLIPVPLHPVRQRERGFNQAIEIGERAANRLKLSFRPVLKRIRYTESQTGFDRQHRITNLRKAFIVRDYREVLNQHCVLVDDVFTTGSTLNACARELLIAGAASVRCVVVARG